MSDNGRSAKDDETSRGDVRDDGPMLLLLDAVDGRR
jgi:hypothetical protein